MTLHLPSTRRVVEDRSLGIEERDAEWTDCDGDRWRYNHSEACWENKIGRPDCATTWYTAVPHERNGPYTEVIESSSTVAVARTDNGPAVEDSPAPRPNPLDGAAPDTPLLSRDDLMDAANAASHMASARPAFEKHWRGLEQRLEAAAIAAS